MCKNCNFTYVNEQIGEKSNDVQSIKRIRDGHSVIDLNIFRYDDGDGHNTNKLIMDVAVEIGNNLYTVVEEHIKINYCPFCGEKL